VVHPEVSTKLCGESKLAIAGETGFLARPKKRGLGCLVKVPCLSYARTIRPPSAKPGATAMDFRVAAQQTSAVIDAPQSLTDDVVPNSVATINATLDDVGTRISTLVSIPRIVDVSPLPDSTPHQLLERLFELSSFTWATTDAPSTGAVFKSYYPFDMLYSQSIIADVLSYYSYIKCDMEIQFRMQTTQFYQGSLMFTVVPFDFTANTPLSTSVYARSWQRPIVLSAQCEDSVILKMPWLRPTRFEAPGSLITATARPWSIMVDILSPLRVASASAPDSVSVQITGRFVNPHLVWPVNPAAQRKKLNPAKQSGKTTDTIAPARGAAQKVHVTRGKGNPVDEAKSSISTTSTSAVGSVVSTIDSVSNSIMDVLGSVAPLAELAGLFLDKPQLPEEAARMFIAPATNFTASDVRDQGYSLSLYKTAYLGTNPDVLPESSDVSWLAIAMRPALQFVDSLTNTSGPVDHQSHPITTPFGWAISSHLYWRGSIRFRINFYASTFVSGRVLIVYSPPSSTAVTTINNTISRLISVKGDTTVEFTIPYVASTDFLPLGINSISGVFYGTGVLSFSVYGVITSSDSSTDAVIDFVAWSAAAPDAQFVQPLLSSQYGLTPDGSSLRPVRQADICEAFKKTFAPYVDGCEYLTDAGYVASEISRSPMDVLKRYQVCLTNATPGVALPGVYSPAATTLGWQIQTAFLFLRGGVNYKAFPNVTNQAGYLTPENISDVKWAVDPTWFFYSGNVSTVSGSGLPYLTAGQSDSEIDVSVPYTNHYPYIFTNDSISPNSVPTAVYLTPRKNPISWSDATPTFIAGMDVYTCVRDDFMMGWLLAPYPYTPALKRGVSNAALPHSQSAAPSASTQTHKKQLSMLDFIGPDLGF